jgi:hypothetical protein
MMSWMYIDLHVKYLLFLPHFNKTWIFSTDFWKLLKYQISEKSEWRDQGCYMRMDRQTDGQTDRRDEANSYFAQILRTRLEIISKRLWRCFGSPAKWC